jgi:hypothetical protein
VTYSGGDRLEAHAPGNYVAVPPQFGRNVKTVFFVTTEARDGATFMLSS